MATEFNNTITEIVVDGDSSNELLNLVNQNFNSPFFDGYYTGARSLQRDRKEVLHFIEQLGLEFDELTVHYEAKAEDWDKEGIRALKKEFGIHFGNHWVGPLW